MADIPRAFVLLSLCMFVGHSAGRSYNFDKRQAVKDGLCHKTIDIVFILDSSESVGAVNWDKILNFTRKVASKFDVKSTRFGVVQYHSSPEVPIMLSSFKDSSSLDTAISDIYFKAGATRTDLAISKAVEVFNKATSRKASRVALFVIGGRSTDLYVSKGKRINATDLLRGPAEILQGGHVASFTAAISQGLPDDQKLAFKQELNIIASIPPIDHIFESSTYDELLKSQAEAVGQKLCLVNGGMSPWSSWSECSVTCGYGTRVRMRACDNPKPENGGLPCVENTVQSGACMMQPCPGTVCPCSPCTTTQATTTSRPQVPPTQCPCTLCTTNQPSPTPPLQVSPVQCQCSPKTTNPPSTSPHPKVLPVHCPCSPNTMAPPVTTPRRASPPAFDPSPLLQNSSSPPITNIVNVTVTTSMVSNDATNSSETSKPSNGTAEPEPHSPDPSPKNIERPVTKPTVPSPRPTPEACRPLQSITHGFPDYYKCGKGFELLTIEPQQFSASSTYTKDSGNPLIRARHAPYNALLNNTQNAGAWCAEHQFAVTHDNSQYLQVDLGHSKLIGKIATQGMAHWDNWVTTFGLKFSDDNIKWDTYVRTLQGNCDRHSTTENILNPPVIARFLRINPLTWYTAFEPEKHDICLRLAIYKCKGCDLTPASRCQINSQTGINTSV